MLAEITNKYLNGKEIIGVYNNWNLSDNVPLGSQVEELHEDLFQVKFIRGFLIDIGWYPEHQKNVC